MKKSLLATAIKTSSVLAVAALSTAAYAAPEVYGQVRLSLAHKDGKEVANTYDKDAKVWKFETKEHSRPDLASGNSRLGFKGKEALTENTDLEYRLEYRIDVAEGTASNFSARYGYLALDNKQYGKLLAGRTISQDDFLSTSIAWWRGAGVGFDFGHDAAWVSNNFVYTTPKFNDGKTTAFVQYGMDEGSSGSRTFSTFKDGKEVDGGVSRDFVMVGAQHSGDKTYLGVSYTRAGDDLNSLRGSVSHKVSDNLTLNGLAQYTDFNSDDNELGVFGGFKYKIKEPVSVWLEGYYADNYKGYSNGKSHGANLGVQYDFSKSTLAFANVGYGKHEYGTQGYKDVKGVEIGTIFRF